MSALARAELVGLRGQVGFDEVSFGRYGEQERFRERHGLSHDELFELMKATRPKGKADRFRWLEAVIRNPAITARGLRVAGAIFSHIGETNYAWPSQRRLAKLTGLTERNVRIGLDQLKDVGAIRRLRTVDLPAEVASVALAPAKDGGSGKSHRSASYAIVPPEAWAGEPVTGPKQTGENRSETDLYNPYIQPQPATLGFSLREGKDTTTVIPSGTVPITVEVKNNLSCREEDRHDAA